VISIFAGRLLRGEELTIFGDGLQSRDFVHVSTVVAALQAGMRRADTSAPVFNVCTGRSTTVLQLARTLAEACGEVPVIRHAPGRAGEVRHSVGAPDAARTALGLGEPPQLLDGLRDVVGWMRAGRPLLATAALAEGD
jgi:UDP-glucose 4-epimerase